MHRFLRAIGFSNIKSRRDFDPILGKVMDHPDKKRKIQLTPDCTYTEFAMEVGSQIGIVLRGEYDKKGFFYMEHYFPYCESRLITSHEDVTVNKRVDTNAFTGMCDDLRLGISVIFYLQNAIDYMELHCADNTPRKAKLTLSGLSLKGTVILGVYHDVISCQKQNYITQYRNHLISKAKNGDQKAIDDLAIGEISTSSMLRSRIKTEDLYSIVKTSIVPYGSESDHCSVLGIIVNWSVARNALTNEEVYQMLLNCNHLLINVCIHKDDLLGEPEIGRRFKGVIWMQGHSDFL